MHALIPASWDPRSYAFWLIVVSATVLALEQFRPWRRNQRVLRKGIGQDLLWLLFNGHFADMHPECR